MFIDMNTKAHMCQRCLHIRFQLLFRKHINNVCIDVMQYYK